jgi:hypothetical protein
MELPRTTEWAAVSVKVVVAPGIRELAGLVETAFRFR